MLHASLLSWWIWIQVAEEPIYADPPPVPVKLYDVEVEVAAADKAAADGEDAVALRGAAGGVAVDDNAQDSGSGYYTVTNDNLPGLPNMVNNPHPEIPGMYWWWDRGLYGIFV